MILLDTTVLIYAVGTDHPLRQPSRRILAAHRQRLLRAATTVEVLQEFCHVYSRRRTRALAASHARGYAKALVLHAASDEDLDLGLKLFESLPDLGSFDSVLAAVALNRRVDALISADRAFGTIPGLNWIRPDDPACAQFLL